MRVCVLLILASQSRDAIHSGWQPDMLLKIKISRCKAQGLNTMAQQLQQLLSHTAHTSHRATAAAANSHGSSSGWGLSFSGVGVILLSFPQKHRLPNTNRKVSTS